MPTRSTPKALTGVSDNRFTAAKGRQEIRLGWHGVEWRRDSFGHDPIAARGSSVAEAVARRYLIGADFDPE